MLTMGSYNKYHRDFIWDCTIISGINVFSSLFGGLAIFSVIGYMSYISGVPINQVAEAGTHSPTYVYVVTQKETVYTSVFFFPRSRVGIHCVSQGSFSNACSSTVGSDIFLHAVEPNNWFTICLCWGYVDLLLFIFGHWMLKLNHFSFTALVTAVLDEFASVLHQKYAREIVAAVVCFLCFLFGLPMVTEVTDLLSNDISGKCSEYINNLCPFCFREGSMYSRSLIIMPAAE